MFLSPAHAMVPAHEIRRRLVNHVEINRINRLQAST